MEDRCFANGQSRHLFPRHFFVGISSGVVGENRPGMIIAQFILSLPPEAGSSIERPANICLSTRRRLVITGWARVNDFHCYSEMADWFAKLRAGFGIDIRTPAFDRRVVEFCIGIPEDQYLRKGCDRWLIRRAMKGRLPDVVLYKRKYGVQAADWYPRLTRERDTHRGKGEAPRCERRRGIDFGSAEIDCDLGRLARA